MTAVAAATGTVDEQIGARVHQLMWENRMTQRDMAGRLGIQQSAMSRKLRGARPWLAAEVATVAEALGVTPGQLYPVEPAGASPFPANPQASGGDTSTTRRNYASDGHSVLVRPQFGASRTAVVASATTADRERMSA